ncbi:MAG: PqqD family protein [Gemmatimonadaceae bacterium]
MSTHKISGDAVFAEVEDGAVVLHMVTKRYYSLNSTGMAIWGLLAGNIGLDRIASRLSEEYGVDRSLAFASAERLVDELLAEGLLVVVPE